MKDGFAAFEVYTVYTRGIHYWRFFFPDSWTFVESGSVGLRQCLPWRFHDYTDSRFHTRDSVLLSRKVLAYSTESKNSGVETMCIPCVWLRNRRDSQRVFSLFVILSGFQRFPSLCILCILCILYSIVYVYTDTSDMCIYINSMPLNPSLWISILQVLISQK